MDAAKERLNHISVKGECQGIEVIANGNKKVLEIIIPESIQTAEREELGELLVIATNKAIENAEKVFESEMRGMAGGLMGGLGF